MGAKDAKENEGEHLKELADKVMAYLIRNSKYFSPRQHILSHMIKNLLVKLLEFLENGNVKKAIKIAYQIDTKLISMYEEPMKKVDQ